MGRSAETDRVGRTSASSRSAGSRLLTVAAASDCEAPSQMNVASNAASTMLPIATPWPGWTEKAATTSTSPATTRPPHAPALVPVSRDRENCQTPARSSRPPSRGSPGSRLNAATNRLLPTTSTSTTRAMPP